MKFSCEKLDIQEAIMTASRGVSSRSTIPALEGLLFEADEEVTICGYDLKTGIKTKSASFIEEKGKIVLNARVIGDIIRKLPDDTVYFSMDGQNVVTIKCSFSEYNIPGIPADEFPELPRVKKEQGLFIKKSLLKSMISQTIFAVSDNETRPVHTGSLFYIENGLFQMVSVDGFRLAIRTESIEGIDDNKTYSFVVPGGALKELERILDDKDEQTGIFIDEKFILFEANDIVIITRLLDGEFLNYKKAVPTDFSVSYEADVKSLTDSVERVSLIVSEKIKNPIRCLFGDEVVKLYCITSVGKAYDECPLDGRAEEIEIGFNSRYLLDALRACPEDRVKISLKGSLAPCVITPVSGDKFLYLILPVRIKT